MIQKSIPSTSRVVKRSEVGVYCFRCEERKFGEYHTVTTTLFGREVRIIDGVRHQFVIPRESKKRKTFCGECWTDMEKQRGIVVATQRNIFIPAEVDDRFVKGLFGKRIKMTKKLFTLVPTEALNKVLASLPVDVVQDIDEDMKRLADVAHAGVEGLTKRSGDSG